jgi:predicted dithiol-disulfide oxidoreductase (DUF899 family)
MPWMAVEKEYRFEGPDGSASLAGLFEGRRLIAIAPSARRNVIMYPASGGAYPERACVGCSFGADQVAHPAHLNARDATPVYVTRAPQAEIQGFKERMGWELIPCTHSSTVAWVSARLWETHWGRRVWREPSTRSWRFAHPCNATP